jgi:hypothetical protein
MPSTAPDISPALAVALCEDRYTGEFVTSSGLWDGSPDHARCAVLEDWCYCWDRATGRLSAQDEHGDGAIAHGSEGHPADEWEAL